MRGNLLDLLDVDGAEIELAKIQRSGDLKRYSDFMGSEGHRIFRERLYDKRAPLWIFIEVYQIGIKDIDLFLDIVKKFELFRNCIPDESSHSIIKYLYSASNVFLHKNQFYDSDIRKTIMLAPHALSELFNLEVDIYIAIKAFEDAGFQQRKQIKGININKIRDIELMQKNTIEKKKTEGDKIAPANGNPRNEKSPNKGGRPRRGKYAMTAKELAERLRIRDVRKIYAWDHGKEAPEDYPGRVNYIALMQFISRRKGDERAREVANKMNRAAPYGDMDNFKAGNDEDET